MRVPAPVMVLVATLPLYAAAANTAPAHRSATVKIYLVALDDAGKSGEAIGCGDSIVAVTRELPATKTPLTDALRDLLSLHDPSYGQSGLYNALAASTLRVERVGITNGIATVELSGALALGGACDAPRVAAQLRHTILQFATVHDVRIFIDGRALDTVLSGRAGPP